MREIKFRVWYKFKKEMLSVTNLEFRGGELSRIVADVEGVLDFMPDEDVLMQFTGLKDREGKEVYEGDIVFAHAYRMNLIVKWCDGKREYLRAQVGWLLDDGYYQVEFTTHLGINENNREEYANVSVLGNIYEHPDLLKTMNSFGYDPITGKQRGES